MLGYHGTDDPETVLREGLLRGKTNSLGCPTKHICISDTPELAAMYGRVIVVDLAGLDLPEEGFYNGEMRIHEDIPAARLSLYPEAVEPAKRPFVDPLDPAYASRDQQHPTCVRIRLANSTKSGAPELG